jgi:uncharacterized protein involved in exopolysaccharide biosynthesis
MRLTTVVVVLLTLPPLLAYGFAALRPPVYGARSEILFRTGSDTSQLFDQEMQTQVELLRSPAYLGPTAEAMDLEVEELTKAVDAQQVGGSELLRLTMKDEDPRRALEGVSSITDTYVSRSQRQRATDDEEKVLQRQIKAMRTRVARLNSALARIAGQAAASARSESGVPVAVSAERQRLEGEVRVVGQRASDLESRLTDYRLHEMSTNPSITVIASPYLLNDPVEPRPLRSMVAGLLVGILLAGTALALATRKRWSAPHPREADRSDGA